MKNNKDFLKQAKEHYEITKSGLKAQYKHIQECQAFYAGDYMNYKDAYAFGQGSSRKIKEVEFNFVKPYVNAIVGFFAQHRRKPDYMARIEDLEDQRMRSEYLNNLSDYTRENNNADQTETKQDMDFVIGGVGATDTGITINMGEATRNPNGEILVGRVNPLHVGWDPAATETNLTDSRWVYRVKDYDLDEALDLFNADEEDFEHIDPTDDINNYEYNPFGGIQDKIGFEWADKRRNMVRVYFYQCFEIEKFYRVENPLLQADSEELFTALALAFEDVEDNKDDEMFRFDPTSEILVVTKDKRKEIKSIFEQFGIPFEPVPEKRRVYYTLIYSGDKVFQKFKSPSQQGFSIKFKTGDYDAAQGIWTGIVASMRDPVRYYNKALTEIMLIIASNSRGGVLYEESAVDNIQEFEAQWARHNTAVRVNDGALSGGKIQPKATPALQTGYEQILALSNDAIPQVTGIDPSFFGAIGGASGNETALLQRQRIKQATTLLATYMDAIALYSKEQARLMISFMRLLAEASDGALFPVYDDEGNEMFEKLSIDFFADEYEVSIGESPETPVQKEYYVQTIIGIAQSMQAVGDTKYREMYAIAFDHMPLPNKDKRKIIKVLMGEQQIDPMVVEQLQARIQQLEGVQAQVQLAKTQADIEKTKTDTQKILADIQKISTDIRETEEDIEQKAIENDLMEMQPVQNVNVTI